MGMETSVVDACRLAFVDLFETNREEHFYYCSLVTSDECLRPFISAWSNEALHRTANGRPDSVRAESMMRWSYADSPYLDYGAEFFRQVELDYEARTSMSGAQEWGEEEWDAEYQLRLEVMVDAMASLDREGIFGSGMARQERLILVEIVPPEPSNTDRAIALNPSGGPLFREWMEEAAEEPELFS